LPKSTCAILDRVNNEGWRERQEREDKVLAGLGLKSDKDKAYHTSVTITVHNMAKGPRFVIRID
jgi:hypothetical protein